MAEAGMVIVGGGMAGARAIVSLRANGDDGMFPARERVLRAAA